MLFDLHCDTIMRIYKDKTCLKTNDYHIDINKMIKGKSSAQFFAIFVDLKSTDNSYKTCNEMIDCLDSEISKNNEYIQQALNYSGILECQKINKIAAITAIEEGGVLQGSMANLHHFYNRGVRYLTLTWNYENELGYPNISHKESGLKPFGIEVVKEMNKLGMLIDVSHLSDAGFWDCIKYSNSPIIASHSNARAICNHTRNMNDEMILALKENGGVMGMNFCNSFLGDSKISKIDDIIKHIKYIKNLAGIDIIAIGTDFDGIDGPLEIEDMSKMDLLRNALKQEGFTQDEIDKIFYKNAERVINQVLK